MSRRNTPLQVPFDEQGNVVSRPGGDYIAHYECRDNFVFDDGLAVVGYSQSFSGTTYVDLKSANDGRSYMMFLKDFFEALSLANAYKADLEGKSRMVLVGLWTFQKRGDSIGVRMLAGGGPSSASA